MMKSNAFAKVLESYASKSPRNSSHQWLALARLFTSAKAKRVGDFCRELEDSARIATREPQTISELAGEIPVMQAVAHALGKAPVAAALDEVKRFAERHPGVGVEELESAVAEQLRLHKSKPRTSRQPPTKDASIVPSYERRLEEALGDDLGFGELVSQLESDRRVSAADLKQLAKSFTGRAGKNKSDAIEAIKARHRNLMDARAKQRFNAGQTAA
jgi:hypothetical protein